LNEEQRKRYELALRWYNTTYIQGRGKVHVDQSTIVRLPKYPQIERPASGMNLREANKLTRGVQ